MLVWLAAVYVPLHANAALKELHDTISSEALYAIASDLNHVHLQDTLLMFHQHVTIGVTVELKECPQTDKGHTSAPLITPE